MSARLRFGLALGCAALGLLFAPAVQEAWGNASLGARVARAGFSPWGQDDVESAERPDEAAGLDLGLDEGR